MSDQTPFEIPTPPVRMYAAELDAETCPACAARAGLEDTTEHEPALAIPNPECTHPNGCRCTWL